METLRLERHNTATALERISIEALLDEQSVCWNAGQRLSVEDLLDRVPALRNNPEGVLDLIVHELDLRERAGESPSSADYLERFPWLGEPLALQLQVRELVRASNLLHEGGCKVSASLATANRSDWTCRSPPGYEIEAEVGRGGMGVVYRARQLALNRRVALKVVLAGAHADVSRLARVRVEALAVARLQHPNIVQIFEVGEHDGCPFLALEYVDGSNVARVFAGKPQSPGRAAELVDTLARAVHDVHCNGIIHRDLKPSNILLTVDGAPKIADFGLAKILEGGTTRTDSAALFGTPSYMAPEQATGNSGYVGPATDVYALGAILYELLTGRPPFAAGTPLETLRQVVSSDVAPPRRLVPSIPRDLETISLKCLEKDPRHRYPDGLSLAEDLLRFLEDKPIRARRPTWLETVTKWGRRHRSIVATAFTSIALSLVLAVIGLPAGNARIQGEKKRADEQKARAEANSRKARDVVDRMFTRAAEDLTDIPGTDQVRSDLLTEARNYYEGFLHETSSDSAVRYEAARASMRVGHIYWLTRRGVGQGIQAELPVRQAIALFEPLVTEFPGDARFRLGLAECRALLSLALYTTGRHEEAIEQRRAELALREQLAREFAADKEYRTSLAVAYTDFGNVLIDAGRSQAAEIEYRKALAAWSELKAEFPADQPADLDREAHVHHWLGRVLKTTNRLSEAEVEIRYALALREKLVGIKPRHSVFRNRLAHIQEELAHVFELQGKASQAIPLLERAKVINQRLIEEFPDVTDHRHRLACVYGRLGSALCVLGRSREAEDAYRENLNVWLRVAADRPGEERFHGSVAWGHYNLGLMLKANGRTAEATVAFQRFVEGFEKVVADFPDSHRYRPALIYALVNCPDAQRRDPMRALRLGRETIDRFPASRSDSDLWSSLGVGAYRIGDWDGAISSFEKAMALKSGDDVISWFYISLVHWKRGDQAQALTWLDKAQARFDAILIKEDELTQAREEATSLIRPDGKRLDR
jgi:eukaryotic-like serine/threonine-protein kinase